MRASTFLIPAIVFLLVSSCMIYQANAPEPTFAEAPKIALGEIEGYKMEVMKPSEAELNVLPKDTTFCKACYESAEGDIFSVSVVIGGRSKSSIHRPELCLPSQGFQMVNPHNITVDDEEWRIISLERSYHSHILFGYTFFNQNGYRTASSLKRIFLDVWDRSFYNRLDRWVMVTINSNSPDEEDFKQFVRQLRRFLR